LLLCLSLAFAFACGDEGGEDLTENPCKFEERYLPYQPGYSWSYRVTDLGTGATSTKTQSLEMVTDGTLGEAIQQTTSKATGTTVSLLKVEGEAVVRYRQEDRDTGGVLERTSTYDPGQRRLDEAAEKLMLGAQWDDNYAVTVTDTLGAMVTTQRTDHWEVLGVDVPCSSPLGNFECLQIRRQRTVGGVSNKEFFFARGIGKVKEVNVNQIEELIGCD
jgi:hypothetical protein